MNETSRGEPDPPISGGGGGGNGAVPPSVPSSAAPTSSSLLPSLGTDFDGLGVDSGFSQLSKLLSNDSNPDPWMDSLGSSALGGIASSQSNYRPWEAAQQAAAAQHALAMSSSGLTATTSSLLPSSRASDPVAPPNVSMRSMHGHMATPQPTFYHPGGHYQAPPGVSAHHSSYHDQRLPSFQSQFQETTPQYPAVPTPTSAASSSAVAAAAPGVLDFISPGGDSTYHHLQPRTGADERNTSSNSPTKSSTTTNIVDQHPTLTAQLRKKSRVSSLDAPGSSNNNSGSHNTAEAQQQRDTPGQVAAISSTEPTLEKPGLAAGGLSGHGSALESGGDIDIDDPSVPGGKNGKKKRKRCGECTGCSKKENCGDCAPCRNDKSHQICKQRRCEKLTEKKPRAPKVSQLKLMSV